jgi:protein gp37
MGDTTIEWCDKTWNPTRGCSLVSPGCTSCYAMRQAHRFSGKGKPFEGLTKKRVNLGVVWTGKVRLAPDMLALPFSWRKPQRVFVNSMSDLFHEKLSNEAIAAVFGVMAASPRHTFQILTKRAKRMREWFEWYEGESGAGAYAYAAILAAVEALPKDDHDRIGTQLRWSIGGDSEPAWPLPNVWLGVSVEDQERADERIPELLATSAAVRFVSYEPALGPIDFQCLTTDDDSFLDALDDPDGTTLSWVIVGGESGPGARPFDIAWARRVVDQCKAAGVAVFCKQLGAKPFYMWPEHTDPKNRHSQIIKRLELKDRKGGNPSEWPKSLRVREFPKADAS